MDKEQTFEILIHGKVQGVGFRPFLARLAKDLNIGGEVKNIGTSVQIIVTLSSVKCNTFIDEIKAKKPNSAIINSVQIKENDFFEFNGFTITESEAGINSGFISADMPTCNECVKELFDKENNRYRHPFISCAECGPRFSMIESLPYDRKNTTMADFELCEDCQKEYENISDRRFHAQTISCHKCGPKLIFNNKTEEEALIEAISVIKNDGIIAIKGIGGYHLACSPFDEKTVEKLREIKGREEKPFAVMFKNTEYLKEFAFVSEKEEELLLSAARPIVLLERKNSAISKEVYKNSLQIGAFLPYAPLHYLLLEELGALVLTSANISNEPIIKEDEDFFAFAKDKLDGVLYHKRRILEGLDDSVLKVVDNVPQFIRRSRGYAPEPILLNKNMCETFAAGGDLKATFCFTKGNFAFLSQYFGDLEDKKSLDTYKKSYSKMQKLLEITPKKVASDLHPNYRSSKIEKNIEIQHHHAHIASVMAEHSIHDKMIGIAFDGTGYGADGKIWGGEILVCENGKFIREGHLKYTPLLGGDSSAKDALKTLTCFLLQNDLENCIFDERSQIIKSAIQNNINVVESSSMGRLFDAVSCFLGLGNENRYEGECAIMLENSAFLALKNKKEPYPLHFDVINGKNIIIDPKPLLTELAEAKQTDTGCLALGFHFALANAVLEACKMIRQKQGIKKVALSGGVFQNAVLLSKCRELLNNNGFKVFVNEQVPPNDGGIALGQAFIMQN